MVAFVALLGIIGFVHMCKNNCHLKKHRCNCFADLEKEWGLRRLLLFRWGQEAGCYGGVIRSVTILVTFTNTISTYHHPTRQPIAILTTKAFTQKATWGAGRLTTILCMTAFKFDCMGKNLFNVINWKHTDYRPFQCVPVLWQCVAMYILYQSWMCHQTVIVS